MHAPLCVATLPWFRDSKQNDQLVSDLFAVDSVDMHCLYGLLNLSVTVSARKTMSYLASLYGTLALQRYHAVSFVQLARDPSLLRQVVLNSQQAVARATFCSAGNKLLYDSASAV